MPGWPARIRHQLGRSNRSMTTLEVNGLVTSFRTPRGLLRAVDGLSLRVPAGKTECIAGQRDVPADLLAERGGRFAARRTGPPRGLNG